MTTRTRWSRERVQEGGGMKQDWYCPKCEEFWVVPLGIPGYSGNCPDCGTQMERVELTDEEREVV